MSAASSSNARSDDVVMPVPAPVLPAQREAAPEALAKVYPLRETDRAYVPSMADGMTEAAKSDRRESEWATKWTAEWPLVLVAGMMTASLAVAVGGSFRLGVFAFAIAIALGFVLRLVLPEDRAGMLKVRSRAVDLLFFGTFGAVMLFMALTLPTIGYS